MPYFKTKVCTIQKKIKNHIYQFQQQTKKSETLYQYSPITETHTHTQIDKYFIWIDIVTLVRYSLIKSSGILMKSCLALFLAKEFLSSYWAFLLSAHSSLLFLFFSIISGMYANGFGSSSAITFPFPVLELKRGEEK
jgi:hypothetical protein